MKALKGELKAEGFLSYPKHLYFLQSKVRYNKIQSALQAALEETTQAWSQWWIS